MSIGLLRTGESVDWHDVTSEWQTRVVELAREVRSWSEAEGWPVGEKTLAVDEEQLGPYQVPALTIEVPGHLVILQPVARLVMGAQGRVDLYAQPSMDRVMLLHDGQQWIIRPELGPAWPLKWGRETFVDLVHRLTEGP